MKKIITLLTATVFSVGAAQKAEVQKDVILSDGTAIAKIEKDGCGALSPQCNYYISSLDGEPLITVVSLDMIDPMQSNAGNPEGKVRFLRLSFTGFDGAAEIRNPAMLNTKPKDAVQSIVKAKLIKDGRLDEKAVVNFIKANGNRYSERQKELNPQIIIINER